MSVPTQQHTATCATRGIPAEAGSTPAVHLPHPTTTAAPDGRDAAALVTCARTSRPGATSGNSERGGVRRTGHGFATADECRAAAAAVGPWQWDGREGPVPTLEVAPGLVRVSWPDLNRRERTANRNADRPVVAAADDEHAEQLQAELAEALGEHDQDQGGEAGAGIIRGWSAKSRARMVATIAELDLAPLVAGGDLAMSTLTYPGDWLAVAPNRAAVNKHLETLRKREARAFPGMGGMELWKFEFQQRGAPHIHRAHIVPEAVAYAEELAKFNQRRDAWERGGRVGPPPFRRSALGEGLAYRDWLALNWVDIVNPADLEDRAKMFRVHSHPATVDMAEGARAKDPKRLATYFGKHGQYRAKDYQNEPPAEWIEGGESVGRFWGYRGLAKAKGAATITPPEALFMGRTLARYAQQVRMVNPVTGEKVTRLALRREQRWRAEHRVGPDGVMEVHYRKRWTTTRARRMVGANRTGFLVVNDGPVVAEYLARAAEACLVDRPGPKPVGMRGPVADRVRQ